MVSLKMAVNPSSPSTSTSSGGLAASGEIIVRLGYCVELVRGAHPWRKLTRLVNGDGSAAD